MNDNGTPPNAVDRDNLIKEQSLVAEALNEALMKHAVAQAIATGNANKPNGAAYAALAVAHQQDVNRLHFRLRQINDLLGR